MQDTICGLLGVCSSQACLGKINLLDSWLLARSYGIEIVDNPEPVLVNHIVSVPSLS
eukprot:COSAG06_NODE_455_length_15521_cov_8.312022_17_plen_57_part_00